MRDRQAKANQKREKERQREKERELRERNSTLTVSPQATIKLPLDSRRNSITKLDPINLICLTVAGTDGTGDGDTTTRTPPTHTVLTFVATNQTKPNQTKETITKRKQYKTKQTTMSTTTKEEIDKILVVDHVLTQQDCGTFRFRMMWENVCSSQCLLLFFCLFFMIDVVI